MASRSILISTIPVLLLLLALEPAGSAVKAAPGNETPTVSIYRHKPLRAARLDARRRPL